MSNIQLAPGISVAFSGDSNTTFYFSGQGGSPIMTANTTVVNMYANVSLSSVTLNTLNNSSNSNGFNINSGVYRNQITSYGFTFNQDGDVLTPVNKTRYVYNYTGGNQSFTVPTGVYWIYAKLWGAGGSTGRQGGWAYGADGGGGGHTRGIIPVTPGATIYAVVGSGGYTAPGSTAYYGGGGTGASTGDVSYTGSGGGYCGLFNNGISQAQALAIAGGGGGGGSSNTNWILSPGGAGGGSVASRGQSQGNPANAGGGATQNSGGAGATGNNNGGNAGSALLGGNSGTNNYGGGGGGGYYGGGGGGQTNSNQMGGGGGGSGYIISGAAMAQTYTGDWRNPAFSWDPDLMAGYISSSQQEMPGYGGTTTQNTNGTGVLTGGHAVCVIYY